MYKGPVHNGYLIARFLMDHTLSAGGIDLILAFCLMEICHVRLHE